MTNADRIRKMSNTELAKFIRAVQCNAKFGHDCGFPTCPQMDGTGEELGCNKHIDKTMLEWLGKKCQV